LKEKRQPPFKPTDVPCPSGKVAWQRAGKICQIKLWQVPLGAVCQGSFKETRKILLQSIITSVIMHTSHSASAWEVDEMAVTFSEFIKKVRLDLNMSQQGLAKELNVSFASLNRWENKQVAPSNLARKSFLDFCMEHDIFIPPEILEANGRKE
jgi:putative transcriptional regulator